MTLKFPRYSKSGERLTKNDCYACSSPSFFRSALKEYFNPLLKGLSPKEYFKPFLKNLSPDQIWDLVVLLHETYRPASLEEENTWNEWTEIVNRLTGVLWTQEAAAWLTEDYIARMYPFLEPPTFGEQQ